MPHIGLTCLAGVCLTIPAAPVDKITIHVRTPAIGETMRIEKEDTRTTRTTIFDSLGRKLQEQTDREIETLIYRETLLKQSADGKPVLIRRHYERAQLKAGKTSRNLACQGMDVFIRKESTKYGFYTDDDQPIVGLDAGVLDREFNDRNEKFRLEHLLPGKPVAIGAEWPVDMTAAVKDFVRTGRFAVDAAAATGSGHLQTTSPSGGPQFGRMLYRMEIPIVEMAVAGTTRSRAVSGSKASFELTLDVCIDGSRPDVSVLGTAEVKATVDLIQAGAAAGQLLFAHKCDSREIRKAVLPK